jgi:hypothetical protein
MNDKYSELSNQVILNYVVIFKTSPIEKNFQPIVYSNEKSKDDFPLIGIHQFDSDLNGILPVLWYIMHLPRIGFDVIEINADLALSSHDVPHNILLVPSEIPKISNYIPPIGHTLVIYEDNCKKEASGLKNSSIFDIVSSSDLSQEFLDKHWRIIGSLMKCLNREENIPLHLELLSPDQSQELPLIFQANYLGEYEKVFAIESSNKQIFKNIYEFAFDTHCRIKAVSNIAKYPDKDRKEVLRDTYKTTRIPIVISMPGIAPFQRRLKVVDAKLPPVEYDVCQIIATHRAIAKNGVAIELDNTPSELFNLLDQVEQHCKKNRINNKYIWRTLKRIGKILNEHIGEEKCSILNNASHITAFTDFPIGLAILPDGTAPLCCYKPISYRPLTPLTRALQFEMPKSRQIYLGKRCKVLIAECLEKDDPIRSLSDSAWDLFQENSNNYDNFHVIYSYINSIENLKSFIRHNNDADILVISAHGIYAKEYNLAGLIIGKEIWIGSDNDFPVPPIVFLSSCHASPRGSGSVNISDLLLRSGAIVVLGAFIPVDIRRNALLMGRLFVYMQEAQDGNKQYNTLIDAWTGVVATNAVNEIFASSERLFHWGMSKGKNGTIPFQQFTMKESRGRLRLNHVYEDTITILREIAKRDDMIDYFNSIINSKGFFPESVFYQIVGYPENIFLYSEIFERFHHQNPS